MRANTNSCGILTFAILSYPSVVSDEGKHLGKNHQKLAISAVYVKGGGEDKARHDCGPPRMTDWIFRAI
jgi:hypothetical protein